MKRLIHMVFSLACVATFLGAVFFGVLRPAQSALDEARAEIVDLEERIAKLDQRLLDVRSQDVDTRLPDAMVWRAAERASAELSLQRTVIDLASTHGLTPSSYGAQSFDEDKLGFELEAEATLPGFYGFLEALEAARPAIAIRTLSVRPSYNFDPEQSDVLVSLRMSFWTFWEGQG